MTRSWRRPRCNCSSLSFPTLPAARYYRAEVGPRPPLLFGDQPPVEPVLELLVAARSLDEPRSFEVPGQTVTGELPDLQSAMCPRAGRLAVATTIISHSVPVGDGVVTVVTARAGEPAVSSNTFADVSRSTHVAGADLDADLAIERCFGEAAEYFVSAAPPPEHAIYAPAEALPGPWLSPDSVIAYSAEHRNRLGVNAFDPTEPQGWLPGRRNRQPIWLPAALLTRPIIAGPSWWHASGLSSSGVAAHPVPAEAAGNAWLELVERDAIQRSRLLGHLDPPARINPATLPSTPQNLYSALAERASVTIAHLPSPTGVPVVLVRADRSDGHLMFGAAAGQAAAAVQRALIEALAQITTEHLTLTDPRQVRAPADHPALYNDPAWRTRLDWMLHGPLIDLASIPTIGAVDLPITAAYYEYMARPLPTTVIRVLDPALIPITFGYDSDPDARTDFAQLLHESGRTPNHPLEPHFFS